MKYVERKSSVTTSAPGKLMLFGDHAVVHDFPCIVTAIDQRLSTTVTAIPEKAFTAFAPDVGVESYTQPFTQQGVEAPPRGVAFLHSVFTHFLESFPQDHGVEVRTQSSFASTFGFGSSSAVTVAFGRALSEMYQVPLSNKELFNLCYKAVLSVQGVGSGFDIASAIWGGTIYYVKPALVVEPLNAETLPLIVGYTGVKADTATLVRMVASEKQSNPQKIQRIFERIGALTELARQAIQVNDWESVGELMSQNQALLAELQVSSVELDALNQASRSAGAYGSKLSGAGGGDCMIALAPPAARSAVEKNITAAGGEVMKVKTHAPGVRVEEVR